MEIGFFDKVCTPNIMEDFTIFKSSFGEHEVVFLANDLDAVLFARGRLTDSQMAALTSQLSSHSSVFDSLSDEDKVQFLSSRYNQNFASVDSFRQYLVQNMTDIESQFSVLAESKKTPPSSGGEENPE